MWRPAANYWTFHPVPQKAEFGYETSEHGSAEYTGNTNVWSMITVDEQLGYVYLPFGTPTNSCYGGHRLGNNLFAKSLACLDATTGKRVWHFQGVHHGLWDYDFPAAPILVNITVNGRPISDVAKVTVQPCHGHRSQHRDDGPTGASRRRPAQPSVAQGSQPRPARQRRSR